MPTTNNPDVFFLSNFNLQVLRDLQKQMLEEVLALNPIQNGVFEKETFIRYARIRAIHAAIKSENVFTKSIYDDKLKSLQEQLVLENATIQEELKTNRELQNNVLAAIKNIYIEYINETFNNEFLEYSNHNDVEPQYTFAKNKSINTTPIIQSKGFPKFGGEPINYSNEIDEYINSGSVVPFKQKVADGTIVDFKTSDGTPIFNGWSVKTKSGYLPDPMRNFTKNRDYQTAIQPLIDSFYANTLQAPPGAVRFFIEKLHGAYSDFKPYGKRGVVSERTPGYNYNLSNRAVFAAFVDNVNESLSANTTQVPLLGASEVFNIYQNTTRTINMTFSIISDYSLELLLSLQQVYLAQQIDKDLTQEINRIKQLSYFDKGLGFFGMPGTPGDVGGTNIYADTPETLWKKVTFLQQCMYPYYRVDGKLKEMPMVRLRFGDYLDVNGFFTSLSFDAGEFDNLLDLNPSNLGVMPFGLKVNLTMTIVHDWMPSSNFYGFWNRKEFDTGEADRQTGEGLFMNKTKFGDVNTRIEDTNDKDAKGSIPSKQLEQIGNVGPDMSLNEELNLAMNEFREEYTQYKINKANGLDVNDEQEIKKQLTLVERINRITDNLKNLYGYTSQPISSNLPLNERYKDQMNDFNQLKDSAELLFGGINANLNAANDKLRIAEQKARKVGINVKASEEVSDVIKKINQLRLRNLVPRKLNEIL